MLLDTVFLHVLVQVISENVGTGKGSAIKFAKLVAVMFVRPQLLPDLRMVEKEIG